MQIGPFEFLYEYFPSNFKVLLEIPFTIMVYILGISKQFADILTLLPFHFFVFIFHSLQFQRKSDVFARLYTS